MLARITAYIAPTSAAVRPHLVRAMSTYSTPPQARLLAKTRLALVQLGQTSSDKAFNLAHAREAVLRAAKEDGGADLVVLPECFNSPYGVSFFDGYAESLEGLWEKIKKPISASAQNAAKDASQEALAERWGVDGKDGAGVDVSGSKSESLQMLSQVARETGVILVGGSIPERDDKTGKLYNTSVVFNEKGEAISIHRKVHLFDIDIPGKMTFKESTTLSAGDRLTVFDCSKGRFGLAICYDLRFPEPAQIAARIGAAGMIYPGAFNTTTGPRSWELLQRARATDNQFYVAACSPARAPQSELDAGAYPAYGHSTVVDPWASVVQTTEEKEGIVRWTLDPDVLTEARKFVPLGTQRRFDIYPNVVLG
ncbi:Omega-amidase nit3 [Tilletia horrida]|nr:Omega-amidase nit3 [Tilletia horrida]KAK0541571.1 Omega-amidase nit3 [Tilletia horrida]KAK0564365.1 Omega-amidase nit3 [Tilletia horrida]